MLAVWVPRCEGCIAASYATHSLLPAQKAVAPVFQAFEKQIRAAELANEY